MRAPRLRALRLAAAAAAVALACAGAPSRPAPQRVLVTPVSFHVHLPANLELGVAPVGEELEAALAARGVAVSAPTAAVVREIWDAATADLGTLTDAKGRLAPDHLDPAARALAAAFRARGERFDVMLLSYLEVRFVMIFAGSVAWDGVERRVNIVREVGKRLGDWPNHQNAPCVSLRLIAYDAEGARLYEQYGGLDILSEYSVRMFAERPRPQLFQDRALLREGVELALAPLFPD